MDRRISFEEKKQIQFKMLQEIDEFCRRKGIKYSLAFGTLLGAIRHKGFIPWDDDVDIMMPLPDMMRFNEEFRSDTIMFCDVDTTKHYEFPFPRIAHRGTYNVKGLTFKTYGVNIDTYTFISIPDEETCQDEFFHKAQSYNTKFWRIWRARIIAMLPISTIPIFDKRIKDYRNYLYNTIPYGTTNTYYVIAGPIALRKKMTYDIDLFESLVDVEFEGHKFLAISEYDKFLKMRYGDYMQLPPEKDRHLYHGGDYYWKADYGKENF